MTDDERELAMSCYGYGRWDAPYWFVGPEQGQAAWENNAVADRSAAFRKLNKDGLCDCGDFHQEIGELRWHSEQPALQSTWRRLILFLMAYKEKLTGKKLEDEENLRYYQREKWGRQTGETCVVELSGLPARSFSVERDRESFRKTRIELIQRQLQAKSPEFVVVYGKSQMKHWKQASNIQDRLIFAPHPVAFGSTDHYWVKLGQKTRLATAS